jgi:elongation factor Ts
VEIKAADVKKLRDKTGAGMMDCKKALTDAEGDFAKAERILKELGLAAAQKRAGRATNEGRVFTTVNGKKAGILELACETDFVARNAQFVELGKSLIGELTESEADLESEEVQTRIKDAISTIKENMSARRYQVMKADDNEIIVDYVHGDSGNIGVLAKIAVDDASKTSSQAIKDFCFDIALHIAAFNPNYLSEETVEDSYMKEQEEIFTKQAEGLGKPEKVIPGIVKGKLKKHLAEITLLNQPFVKDDKRSVSDVASDLGKEEGTKVEVKDFVYFRVGEDSE